MTQPRSEAIPFTIIINNYNYGRFLNEAIQSALDQNRQDVEVVVVDDGSTDESRDIIAGYGERVVTILKENGGQASAFNAGFAVARGEWILFLDSDDLFARNKVESVASYAQRFSSAGIIAHSLEYCDEQGKAIAGPAASPIAAVRMVDERRSLRRGRLITALSATSALAVRRDILSQILPMPEDIVITADNYIKIAALSLASALLIPDYLATQRLHDGNAYTRFRHTDESRLERCYIGAKIAFRLKERFPQLSRLAWKEYGKVLFFLRTSKSARAKDILKEVQSTYCSFEYSPVCCFYVAGAFAKRLFKNRVATT